ncbi:Sec-independent protein translocase subunit TatA/TatB [Deinococcus hohokamensis]|uniref:Sec-independent protein translocase protein TatA n=1 Tax=Deinococcus hohokamensis TaxID=309883 RepID=A0ABV9ICI1_9DEIO
MPNIGGPELIVILLVALVVFGPRKLPELGRTVGQGLREFRRHTSGITEELRSTMDPVTTPPAPSVTTVTAAPQPVVQAPEAPAPVSAQAS